jgi:hypothetical protein
MQRRRGDPFDDRRGFCGEASGQLCAPCAASISRFDQLSPCRRTKDDRQHGSTPLSKLGLKLAPRNAVFAVLIETYDPPVQLGSMGIGHGNVLVVEALPKGLDQV